MSGDHVELGVNQHGDIKAKGADAFSNLLDLFLAVLARVARSGLSSDRGREMIFKPRWRAATPASST